MSPRLDGVSERKHVPFWDTIVVRWWWRNRVTSWVLRKVFRRIDPRAAAQARAMLVGLIKRDVQ